MSDVRVVRRGDPEYPDELEEIHDPPARIWVRGVSLRDMPQRVGIVGSRSPTPYGEQVAEDLASDLASMGWCIVSGLARGCDGAAHRGALRPPSGRTIAVLGTGIDRCHPRPHRALADRIVEAGALVTEFPPGTPGWPANFRARNRIISGLCSGLVVVQAGVPSGALQTARYAREQGRIVFAVPGNVDVAESDGPHDLIRHGAILVRGANDVIDAVEPGATRLALDAPATSVVEALADPERALLDAIASPTSVESAAIRAGMRGRDAAAALVRLEIAGLAARTRGGLWRRRR